MSERGGVLDNEIITVDELIANGLISISFENLQTILNFLYIIISTLKEGISILLPSRLAVSPSEMILLYGCNVLESQLKLYNLTSVPYKEVDVGYKCPNRAVI